MDNKPIVREEDVLKFYYVRSLDDFWIGKRVGNFYYAEYQKGCFVWTHSRYLPWGEHVIAPNTAWKEHTYPSEPEEIPFDRWLKGFIAKHFISRGMWKHDGEYGVLRCSKCGTPSLTVQNFCCVFGADMMGGENNG